MGIMAMNDEIKTFVVLKYGYYIDQWSKPCRSDVLDWYRNLPLFVKENYVGKVRKLVPEEKSFTSCLVEALMEYELDKNK